jgi:Holliday junction DNA helicase RuvA
VIAHLAGTVSTVAPEGAVIDVGGVGLLVQCSPGTLAGLRPGERAKVSTSLVVREDALTLYGFSTDDERNTFELLQTASGIGPRLALAMLATFSPDGLRSAVAAADFTALTSVPGIGRKGAQRIVLELAGRLGSPGDGGSAGAVLPRPGGLSGAGPLTWRDQVRTGLVSLGWQPREADQAIAAIEPELMTVPAPADESGESGAGESGAGQAGVDVAVALRAALRVLGQGSGRVPGRGTRPDE